MARTVTSAAWPTTISGRPGELAGREQRGPLPVDAARSRCARTGPPPRRARRGAVHPLVLEHPGAVVVLAVDDDERVLCLRQYRHPARHADARAAGRAARRRGRGAPRPPPSASCSRRPGSRRATGRRWLGVQLAGHHRRGASTTSWPAGSARPTAATSWPPHEEADMETLWVPFAELLAAVLDGRVRDAPVLIAVLTAPAARPGRQRARVREARVGRREGRRPEGSQEPRVPRGDHPDRRARAGRPRPRGRHPEGRRRRVVDQRRGVRRRRRHDRRRPPTRRGAPTAASTWCSRSRSRSPRSTTGCGRG